MKTNDSDINGNYYIPFFEEKYKERIIMQMKEEDYNFEMNKKIDERAKNLATSTLSIETQNSPQDVSTEKESDKSSNDEESKKQLMKNTFSKMFTYYEITQLALWQRGEGGKFRFLLHAFDDDYNVIIAKKKSPLIWENTIVEIITAENKTTSHFEPSEDVMSVTGRVLHSPGSHVMGTLDISGIVPEFKGIITIGNLNIFIEPVKKYFDVDNQDVVVYKNTDAIGPKCIEGEKGCGFPPDTISYAYHQQGKMYLRHEAVSIPRINYTNKLCSLEVVMDTRFVKPYPSLKDAHYDLTIHFWEADNLFRNIDFDNDKHPDNVGFFIEKFSYDQTLVPDLEQMPEDKRAETFFEACSKRPGNHYCLVVCFTNVGMINVTGMAPQPIVQDLNITKVEGICQGVETKDSKSDRNLNVVMVNGKETNMLMASQGVLYSRLLHHLGHAFGSKHDDETELCSPGGTAGNFIMNKNFTTIPISRYSPCSVSSIYGVLQSDLARCLQSSTKPYCGNGVREGDELCDCGNYESCKSRDYCCVPKYGLGDQEGCKVLKGYTCSLLMPCCTSACELVPAHFEQVCNQTEVECRSPSMCQGDSPHCPDLQIAPDGMACLMDSQTCSDGKCFSNVCMDRSLSVCECAELDKACQVCCITNDNQCKSSAELNFTAQPVYRYPGNACDSLKGYCTTSGACVPLNLTEPTSTSIIYGQTFRPPANTLPTISTTDNTTTSTTDDDDMTLLMNTEDDGDMDTPQFTETTGSASPTPIDQPERKYSGIWLSENWPYFLNLLLLLLLMIGMCCLFTTLRRKPVKFVPPAPRGPQKTGVELDF